MFATASGMVMDKKPAKKKYTTIQIRCDRDFLTRLKAAARQSSVSAAAYIRLATSKLMDQDAVPLTPPKPPRR